MASAVEIPIRDVTRDVVLTVRITGVRGWEVRLKVAKLLFRLGAWIAGLGIRFEQ